MRYLFIPLMLLSFNLLAQTQGTVDMSRLSETREDSSKVNLLLEISNQMTFGDPEKAKGFASEAFSLSQQINYEPGWIKSAYQIGTIYIRHDNRDSALLYYNRGLDKAKKIDDKFLEALGLYNMSHYYVEENNLPTALDYLNQSAVIYEKLGRTKNLASCYNSYGNIYLQLGNYEQSLSYFFKALEIREKIKDQQGIAISLSNIGNLYLNTSKYEDAIRYLSRGLKIDQANNDQDGILIDLLNIGVAYQKSGILDKALTTYKEALVIAGKLDSKPDQAILLNNIGSTLKDQGHPREGLPYLFSSLALKDSIHANEAHLLNDIAETYLDLKDFQKAKNYALLAVETGKRESDLNQWSYAWLVVARSEQKLGDYQNAYDALMQYKVAQDSLFTLGKARQMNELEVQYETGRKEQEIKLLTQQKEAVEFKRNSFAILSILLLLVALLVFVVLKSRVKRNRLLLKNEIEMDKMKSRFFSNISHEFRTPLTLILGPIEDMISQPENSGIQKYLKPMRRNAARLLELVNQLLELSKLESGKLKPELTKNNIVSLVKGVTMSFHSLAELKEIQMEVIAQEEPIEIYVDRDKIETILTNLLSNAFKFTPDKGKIVTTVRQTTDCQIPGGAAACLEIIVKDSGSGIPQADLIHIFDRFYQADNNQLQQQDGSGIGLALTQELVELHRGKIMASSEEGVGTEIRVQIPMNLDERMKEFIIESITPAAGMVKRTNDDYNEDFATTIEIENDTERPIVLVIEDQVDVRNYIRDTLEKYYQVIESKDGEEGVAVALEQIPDLIISDVMMPKMNGYQVCKKLRKDERTSHIPIILLTAKADTESRIEGLEAKPDDYLTKPFIAKELLLRIRNLIESRQNLRNKYLKVLTLKPSEVVVSSIEEQFLKQTMHFLEDRMDDDKFSVEDLSSLMSMSRSQLHRKLKALTGQGPNQFIRTFRLNRAHDLLQQNAATPAEIAYTVGFSSPSYFTKCFHEQFGCTPSELQKK